MTRQAESIEAPDFEGATEGTGGLTGSTGSGNMKVSFDNVLVPLTPDATHTYTDTAGAQVASVNVSVSGAPATGWQMLTWNWSNDYPPPQGSQLPSGTVWITSGASSQSASGVITGPGEFVATCVVGLLSTDGLNRKMNVTLYGTCAGFGGPITFTLDKPLQPVQTVPTWAHDGDDLANSWFLEYFGYDMIARDPNTGVYSLGGPPNTKWQGEQYAKVSTASQPGTCVFTWTLPSCVASPELDNKVNSGALTLVPEAAGKDQPVTCTYDVTWVDPDDNTQHEASTTDDTAGSTVRLDPRTLINMVGKVSCHQPKDSAVYSTAEDLPGRINPGDGVAGTAYLMLMTDTVGGPFPGLMVEEHYTTVTPPNFGTNGGADQWLTACPTGADLSSAGVFTSPDFLQYRWLAPMPPGGWDVYTYTHIYMAATLTVDGLSGLACGTWTMLFTPPTTSPGTGTAIQTKQ